MTTITDQREAEKQRYLDANLAKLPDAAARWVAYEDLMLQKFGDPPKQGVHRSQALDIAWVRRDRANSR
jgi:hypothetical protein